jgi:hypothetical protein
LDLGLTVASAALAGGVDIVEMGTPLLKTQGVSNVVPAFRKRFPDALLLADMKTMEPCSCSSCWTRCDRVSVACRSSSRMSPTAGTDFRG